MIRLRVIREAAMGSAAGPTSADRAVDTAGSGLDGGAGTGEVGMTGTVSARLLS
jgi:hypothetical protein